MNLTVGQRVKLRADVIGAPAPEIAQSLMERSARAKLMTEG
jgi:hypothetical protein